MSRIKLLKFLAALRLLLLFVLGPEKMFHVRPIDGVGFSRGAWSVLSEAE